MPVDIVTGDRDLFQLIDDKAEVRVLYIARGVAKHERMTEHTVVEKYSVLPQQYADFATLRGDASDGLPGVAGVGDKTAASLLLSYGDLSGIRAAAADPGSALVPAREARSSPRPTTSTSHRPWWPWRATSTSARPTRPAERARRPRALAELAERWGLSSPVERLTGVLAVPVPLSGSRPGRAASRHHERAATRAGGVRASRPPARATR